MTLSARFAIPGDLATPTGGYEYDRRLIAAAPEAGLDLAPLALPGGFPDPSAREMALALAALERPGPILADGLAMGVIDPALWPADLAARLVVLCHHPLGLETGLAEDRARALVALESRVLAAAAAVIVTSDETARTLAATLGVAPGKIAVAPPGLDPAPAAPRRGDPPVVLGVGTISARKDWPTLVAALARVAGRDWRCVIAGDAARDAEAASTLRALLVETGLEDRVALPGALPRREIDALYARADLFCLPSRYEGFGMVVVEAMARGLPVLAAEAGATPEAAGGAALLLPPGDVAAWAAALDRLLADPAERDRMAAASLARAARAPGWADAARIVAGVLRRLPEGAPA